MPPVGSAGLADHLILALVEAFFLLFQAGFQAGNFGFVAFDFRALLLDGDPVFLQTADDILKGFILGLQMRLRVINDLVRQAQLFGDGKGVTLTWDAD